jgi:hypothetical protein
VLKPPKPWVEEKKPTGFFIFSPVMQLQELKQQSCQNESIGTTLAAITAGTCPIKRLLHQPCLES